MIHEPQRVALPAVLRQGLTVFREVEGKQETYRIRDKWKGQTYQLEAWQFFVLEVLPVCNDFPKLASVFEDRFGRPITTGEVDDLFSVVEEMKLFGLSADAHPLVAAFYKKKGIQLALKTAAGQTEEAAETKGNGGNGKGGKGRGSASPESGAGAAMEHASGSLPGASSVAVVFNSADFTVHEFKMQNKDIEKLCRAIRSDGYKLDVKAPENTVDWLNAALQTPDFYDQAAARKPKMKLSGTIKKLKEQTENARKASFKDLRIDEQNAIRRMNRLLMELLYSETPRGFSPDDSTAENEISWKLFNPTGLIKRIHPFLSPLKYAVYMVPVLTLAAFFTGIHHSDLIRDDLSRMGWISAAHVLTSMLTVNLLAVLVTALTAHSFRATVNSFGIMLLFRFFPLFSVQIGHTEQFSRRERIWLHAAPLLARAGMASVCLLLWFGMRTMNGFLPQLALMVGVIGTAVVLLDANPLMRSSGSRLLGAVLNEPNLRFKAYLALVNRLRGDVYRKTDNSVLAAYALASSLFMVAIVTVFFLFFGNLLKLHLGGAGIFLVVLIILMLALRLTQNIKHLAASHERIARFERWRNRTLPSGQAAASVETETKSVMSPVQWLIVGSIAAGLFVPYHYEPGGSFVLLPNQKAELTTETGGIISRVYFNGGEFLRKGTVVAKLNTTDYEGQVKIYEAKVREQQSVVDDLKSRPTPEELNLAKQALEVRKRQALFSGQKLKRLEILYKEKTISLEEFEDQRKQAEVDAEQVREYRAKLELIQAGATDEEIAAAEARLQSYKEERDYYKEKINQSTIAIPFDGRLEGVNLKLKAGRFLNKGELFAVAQNTSQIVAEIEVPEPDIGYIRTSSNIRLRPLTYSDTDFTGTVTAIDAGVTEKASGRVVKVVTLLDNKDDLLKSGMTGYAKISAENVPVGKVLSRAIVRFFEVEVWSWLP